MSQLHRFVAKARVSDTSPNLNPATVQPNHLREHDVDEDFDVLEELPAQGLTDEDSSSASSASSASSTGTIKPSPSKHLFARPKGLPSRGRNLDPLPWYDYFKHEFYLDAENSDIAKYHVYLTHPEEKGPLFVTHHGAGSSGLSFALFASEIQKILPTSGILSLDARGHGDTRARRDIKDVCCAASMKMDLPTLGQDLINVIELTQKKVGWKRLPNMILIGHSLGGAVVTEVANGGFFGDSVLGYCVLDVVEGSALDALQSMTTYLNSRPKTFPSISAAVDWHLRSRTIRDNFSARISVPSLLQQYLAATKPFWEGWFVGLSKKFLEARGGKLLLLAGTDRLDKELMIGQMQGKYQLQVFPDAGHFIHEDQAPKTATIVADFYKRNDRSALVLPPKVGAVLQKTAQ